jgi:pyrroline-5-carboxylate reductase
VYLSLFLEHSVSPGGTTAAGLLQLELASMRAAFIQAVRAATNRSIELGAAAPPSVKPAPAPIAKL